MPGTDDDKDKHTLKKSEGSKFKSQWLKIK